MDDYSSLPIVKSTRVTSLYHSISQEVTFLQHLPHLPYLTNRTSSTVFTLGRTTNHPAQSQAKTSGNRNGQHLRHGVCCLDRNPQGPRRRQQHEHTAASQGVRASTRKDERGRCTTGCLQDKRREAGCVMFGSTRRDTMDGYDLSSVICIIIWRNIGLL